HDARGRDRGFSKRSRSKIITPIAARARTPNPFERFSKIALGLMMAVSFTGALRVAHTVPRIMCVVCCGIVGERSHFTRQRLRRQSVILHRLRKQSTHW